MVTPPERGDVAWFRFDPSRGHEQKGTRPALILSPAAYNAKPGLCLAVPITSHSKGYPFEVPLPPGLAISGVALADQVKCLDWRERLVSMALRVPRDVVLDVTARLIPLLGVEPLHPKRGHKPSGL